MSSRKELLQRRRPTTLWRRRWFDLGSWRQEVAGTDHIREAAEDLVHEAAAVDLVHLIQEVKAAG
jgi:hypothetical protein